MIIVLSQEGGEEWGKGGGRQGRGGGESLQQDGIHAWLALCKLPQLPWTLLVKSARSTCLRSLTSDTNGE